MIFDRLIDVLARRIMGEKTKILKTAQGQHYLPFDTIRLDTGKGVWELVDGDDTIKIVPSSSNGGVGAIYTLSGLTAGIPLTIDLS